MNESSGRCIRDRQRVRGLVSLGQRKPDKPTTSRAWEEHQELVDGVHLDQMIKSLKAVLHANPQTQLVVCGYVLEPCPWTLPLLPCVSPVPIT